jgi:deoxyribodipyrimidine photo-lyase
MLRAIHIFRRDLRTVDNTALHAACKESAELLPIFIFDPRQTGDHPFRSKPGLQFLCRSLQELNGTLQERGSRLALFFGEAPVVLEQILVSAQQRGTPFGAVFCNRDYTPFSRNRDRALSEVCKNLGVTFHLHGDALLHEPESVLKNDGKPYTVYTPFSKKALTIPVRPLIPEPSFPLAPPPLPLEAGAEIYRQLVPTPQSGLLREGGRSEALGILRSIGTFTRYDEERNIPALSGTTGLSPHHKFGTLSAREVFTEVSKKLGTGHTLIRELLWRDFFHHIAFHFPHVFQGAFNRSLDALQWRDAPEDFARWCRGETGFPLVDAGMRELNQSGFMHNRVRMVVASFLTKDLQISWREGERYFAQKLLDYDPSVNNGNWQWAASTGCDAQPYFRIFNPWLQQEKFDEDGVYIKRWVPELRTLPPKQLHALGEEGVSRPSGYPAPMVDHAEAKEATLTMFAEAKGLTNPA